MHICIVGTGYVGLVTGTCFAEFGNDVVCVDNDGAKIRRLQEGQIPIYEPGLEDLVSKNVKEGRLSFADDLESAVSQALVVFVAVGTPPGEDGSADLRHVEQVVRDVASYSNGYKVIVTKSTVPVGCGKKIQEVVRNHAKPGASFGIVSNPEFLREGSAIEDFMHPNRVIIGADSSEAIAIMKELYSPLYLIETPFVITNIESAELIKYAANAFLATKISFINEIANFCEKVGADVHHVAKGMGLDRRIGSKFLHPGPGFGGSCFPKDTRALVEFGKEADFAFRITKAAVEVNQQQNDFMVSKIKHAVGELNSKQIGVLGLSFKPNTNDIRDAPSRKIIDELLRNGALVKAFDPAAMTEAKAIWPDIDYCVNMYEAARQSDALVLVTEWNQFRSMDLDRIKSNMRKPVIIDLRNIYEPDKMRQIGFDYTCVGRPTL